MKRAALLPLAAIALLAGCGGSGDQSGKVASQIGATSCTAENYLLQNRLDGSKQRIYSCDLNGRTICVIDQGGLARDVTAEAKLLWQGTLGASQPSCLG